MKLRIISGIFKGRLISVPDSELIRPTTDRVRETLFNILNNKLDFNGLRVLDLYSGSGSLGLECISRGAEQVTFVEKDFSIYKNLISNIKSLGVEDKCILIKSDALKFSLRKPDGRYDLILADPPFFKYDVYEVIRNLTMGGYPDKKGIIVVERSVQTREEDTINFGKEPFKVIGDACLYEISG